MAKLELIATATFGLEAVVKREIENLGYKILKSEDGKISFLGDERALVKANLCLRSADRVLVKMGEFEALSFEELFQQTGAFPWEEWITPDGKFTVNGTSVKSKLFSISDCQSIVKKSIVERLKAYYDMDWFPEDGAEYQVKFTILKDRVTLTIDSSGPGLHKRGYRLMDVAAPMKETLAAALVQLSFWRKDRLLVDPFCGSGTIVIEAAMLEKNIAPGLLRSFASEEWPAIPSKLWEEERQAALERIDRESKLNIICRDKDPKAIKAAKINAEKAGVADSISFQVAEAETMTATEEYGIIITNPPYGERMGDKKEMLNIYKFLGEFIQNNPGWSLYLITADKEFEKAFREKPADRRRKLYAGKIETCYYQYYGLRPPKI